MQISSKKILSGIVTYILANEPVTLEQLEERARGKDWYTTHLFTKLIIALAKHPDISAVTNEQTLSITYRRKKKRAIVIKRKPQLPPYPTETSSLSPFKVCSCPLFHKHWRFDFGHFSICDAIVYSADYKSQNPWDRMGGVLIDKEAYETEVRKREAISKNSWEKRKFKKKTYSQKY